MSTNNTPTPERQDSLRDIRVPMKISNNSSEGFVVGQPNVHDDIIRVDTGNGHIEQKFTRQVHRVTSASAVGFHAAYEQPKVVWYCSEYGLNQYNVPSGYIGADGGFNTGSYINVCVRNSYSLSGLAGDDCLYYRPMQWNRELENHDNHPAGTPPGYCPLANGMIMAETDIDGPAYFSVQTSSPDGTNLPQSSIFLGGFFDNVVAKGTVGIRHEPGLGTRIYLGDVDMLTVQLDGPARGLSPTPYATAFDCSIGRTASGVISINAGANHVTAKLGGSLSTSVAAVGNIGGGTDTLITYTLPTNTLNANGRKIRIRAYGTAANNSNPKALALMFGATAILSQSLTVSQAGRWVIDAEVIRTGVDAQDTIAELHEATASLSTTHKSAIQIGTATIDDGATIAISVTGAVTDGGGGINDNDIVCEGMFVSLDN